MLFRKFVNRITDFFRQKFSKQSQLTVISPSYEIMYPGKEEADAMFSRLEDIGRICYKSEDRKTETSKFKFIKMLTDRGHHAILEHSLLTVKFVTTRGFSHELVRHRIASFAQESQRYVNYKDGMTIICPPEIKADPKAYKLWLSAAENDAATYNELLKMGFKPQITRASLPNCVKTEIVISANWREWRNILQLRTSQAAHPEMRELMVPLLREIKQLIPIVFEDIIPYEK